jgi:hypothetical protein
MNGAIYRSDPDAPPDSEFTPGELSDLVVGNRGRLLDARRTPITVTSVAPEIGAFEVEIGDFEDAGARWELPLHDVRRFQFARGGEVATRSRLTDLRRAASKFDRELVIGCDPADRDTTLKRIQAERRALRGAGQFAINVQRHIAVEEHIATREGNGRLIALLQATMTARGLADLEQRFTAAFVSNPGAGELVKGHGIVLAELGLCPYRGQDVRNPETFTGPLSRARRAEHLIARLAFTQEMWALLGHESVTLYRGMAAEGPWEAASSKSFVSATFSRQVAGEHFEGGPGTQNAMLIRQQVPISRVVMTFLETRAMSERFKEAEAVLIADPGTAGF